MKPKVTPWFPADVKPVHEGWYETTIQFGHPSDLMRMWKYGCWVVRSGGPMCWDQDRIWRGLARKPK